MPTVHDVCRFLDDFAPPGLAEEWDNVGLLVGRAAADAGRIMTCLTVTPYSASEAVAERANLIVTHHPLPFRALRRITDDSTPGRLLLQLIEAGVAVYSPHTAFDSAAAGINQRLAEGLGLIDIAPLRPIEGLESATASDPIGAGRFGRLLQPESLATLAERVKSLLNVQGLKLVGDLDRTVQTAAVACGSAGEFLEPARRLGCEVLLTGETSFHTCLEAEAAGVALLLPGHYASERFALEYLAEILAETFPDAHVWASRRESDPLRWF
ncbi:MAG: Nif3-like dinuclear metal center hexameric protein [Planctomycetes bacterium]|nr:Nif3-like dinuclear metal center hexameric protein [Planctomycetota bacterium]